MKNNGGYNGENNGGSKLPPELVAKPILKFRSSRYNVPSFAGFEISTKSKIWEITKRLAVSKDSVFGRPPQRSKYPNAFRKRRKGEILTVKTVKMRRTLAGGSPEREIKQTFSTD